MWGDTIVLQMSGGPYDTLRDLCALCAKEVYAHIGEFVAHLTDARNKVAQ